MPPNAVADELLSIATRNEDSELKLRKDFTGLAKDGAILWTPTYLGKPVGQLQIRLQALQGGASTKIHTTYIEPALSAEALEIPNLADRSYVRKTMAKALDLQIEALAPSLQPFERFVKARHARQLLVDVSFEEFK